MQTVCPAAEERSPFDRTPEFAEVFGEGKLPEGIPCAAVSDVDMIFSNIFVESGKAAADSAWTVIDYEWTFAFPIPKKYLIYRAIYFAYYQIFKAKGKVWKHGWHLPVSHHWKQRVLRGWKCIFRSI